MSWVPGVISLDSPPEGRTHRCDPRAASHSISHPLHEVFLTFSTCIFEGMDTPWGLSTSAQSRDVT